MAKNSTPSAVTDNPGVNDAPVLVGDGEVDLEQRRTDESPPTEQNSPVIGGVLNDEFDDPDASGAGSNIVGYAVVGGVSNANGQWEWNDEFHQWNAFPANTSESSAYLVEGIRQIRWNGSSPAPTLLVRAVDDSQPFFGASGHIVDVTAEGTGGSSRFSADIAEINQPFQQVQSGTSGDDVLRGGPGADFIEGLGGNDFIDGGGAADQLVGGTGNDVFFVDDAGDEVIEAAGEGRDKVYANLSFTLADNVEDLTLQPAAGAANADGNGSDNVLIGNAFDNALFGRDGVDTLIANGGSDFLNGGVGADLMVGGDGDDTYLVDESGDQVSETSAAGGTDEVRAGASFTLGANLENLVLTGLADIDGTGNALANVIDGNTGSNRLDGGAGADIMRGGSGEDTYVVDNVGDQIVENSNSGSDTVESSVNYTLGANVERLVLTGSAVSGTGNTLLNRITGNALDNFIDGKGGFDTLIGGLGNDTYFVKTGGMVIEAAGEGRDKVYSSVAFTLGDNVEDLTLTAAAGGAAATGNALNNVIYGNDFNNIIQSGAGDDTLIGNAGTDTLKAGLGRDTLQGGADADTFWFDSALGGGNVDRILDFQVGVDEMVLENSYFSGLPCGPLAPGAFNTGSAATQADDRIIYNSATGALFFDSDGTGAAAAVQFATVQAGLPLSASDFTVI